MPILRAGAVSDKANAKRVKCEHAATLEQRQERMVHKMSVFLHKRADILLQMYLAIPFNWMNGRRAGIQRRGRGRTIEEEERRGEERKMRAWPTGSIFYLETEHGFCTVEILLKEVQVLGYAVRIGP